MSNINMISLLNRLTHFDDGSVDYDLFVAFLRQMGTINRFKKIVDILEIKLCNIEKSETESNGLIALKIKMDSVSDCKKIDSKIRGMEFVHNGQIYTIVSEQLKNKLKIIIL